VLLNRALELLPLMGEKMTSDAYTTGFWYLLRSSFPNLRRASQSFLYWSAPGDSLPPPPAPCRKILVSRSHLHSLYFHRVFIISTSSSWNKNPRRIYHCYLVLFLSVGNNRKERQIIMSELESGWPQGKKWLKGVLRRCAQFC